MTAPEPHIPVDHNLRRMVFMVGIVWIAAFWGWAAYSFCGLIWDRAAQRPAVCAHLTAAECSAAMQEGR